MLIIKKRSSRLYNKALHPTFNCIGGGQFNHFFYIFKFKSSVPQGSRRKDAAAQLFRQCLGVFHVMEYCLMLFIRGRKYPFSRSNMSKTMNLAGTA